jgi:AraC-like DNA-binding protein
MCTAKTGDRSLIVIFVDYMNFKAPEMDSLQFWQHPPRVQLCVIMPRTPTRALQFTEHSHSFHELAYLIEGECTWHVGAKRHHLRAGDLLLTPAGTRHYESAPAGARARIGWIGFDFTTEGAEVPVTLRAPLAAHDYAAELRRLFDVVRAEHQIDALGHAERTELALREILILLCRLSPAGTSDKKPTAKAARAPQLVQSAALTLAANLAQPMRIRDLAHYHSLSASHFARLFREHQGVTPQRFLQDARLARAKTLLADDTLNVKEIAAACGYVDAAHFCHAFKAGTRLTPKEFRRKSGV